MIRIGTRESKLAMIQSEMVRDYIVGCSQDTGAVLVPMKTTGDKILDRTLDKIGGKGLFVKELDMALRDGRSSLSVHSLKDVPMEVPKDLPLLGFSKREDPRDVLVLPTGKEEFDICRPVGCSSQRRMIQLKKMYPDILFKTIRGNVLTRLKKLDCGEYGALVLAAAGLKRLGMSDRISRYFSTDEIIPAAGQGILAVQGKIGEDYSYLNGFFSEESFYCAACERAFVTYLNGGCSSPIAAHAKIRGDNIHLTGLYYNEINRKYFTKTMNDKKENAEKLGILLAKTLKEKYGNE